MSSLGKTLVTELEAIRAAQLYRARRVVESFSAADSAVHVVVDGESRINFCGNDYLGLSRHPDVRSAFIVAAGEFGVGSGASHLVTGHSREHHALEEELAAFVRRPRALLFSTGYMANLAAIAARALRGLSSMTPMASASRAQRVAVHSRKRSLDSTKCLCWSERWARRSEP